MVKNKKSILYGITLGLVLGSSSPAFCACMSMREFFWIEAVKLRESILQKIHSISGNTIFHGYFNRSVENIKNNFDIDPNVLLKMIEDQREYNLQERLTNRYLNTTDRLEYTLLQGIFNKLQRERLLSFQHNPDNNKIDEDNTLTSLSHHKRKGEEIFLNSKKLKIDNEDSVMEE